MGARRRSMQSPVFFRVSSHAHVIFAAIYSKLSGMQLFSPRVRKKNEQEEVEGEEKENSKIKMRITMTMRTIKMPSQLFQ